MSYKLPGSLNALQTFAADFLDGLKAHATTVGMVMNTEPKVRADFITFQNAEAACQTARAAKQRMTTAHTLADSNAKAFIAAARKTIASFLSERWSQAWADVGFPNQSTSVPATADERFDLLDRLSARFIARPGWENARYGTTADAASVLYQSLDSARRNLRANLATTGQKRQALVIAEAALRTRLANAIAELACLLPVDDPRWLAFGLHRPADPGLPDVVENLTATPGVPGTVLLEWSDTPHAARYRIWVKIADLIPGVEAVQNPSGDTEIKWEAAANSDFVAVQTREESEAILTGLPTSKTVKVKVSALNDAGEGQAGAVVEIVVP
jgi:hypothetical protein